MFYRHVDNISGCTKHQSNDIRERIFIFQHLFQYKASCGKIAGNKQVLWFVQHKAEHPVVDPASEIPKCAVMLVLIFCICNVCAVFQRSQKLADFVCRRLTVIIQTNQDVALYLMKSRHQCRMLSKISRQIYPLDPFILAAQLADFSKGIVRRAIVDQNDLILIPLQLPHRCFDFVHHTADRFR